MKNCPKCHGAGYYMYDGHHGKPCEICCPHNLGWWELTEHHAGYKKGEDNRCCKSGCGMLKRDLEKDR